jgi:hypothetical protein
MPILRGLSYFTSIFFEKFYITKEDDNEVLNKITLSQRGDCLFEEKAIVAQEAGNICI